MALFPIIHEDITNGDEEKQVALNPRWVKIKRRKIPIVSKCLKDKRKGKTALMGRDLMKIFDFEITEIKVVKPENVVKKMLDEYKDLFDSKLGKYTGEKLS